ncbi:MULTISPECIES: LolA family protein [Desulfobacula]|uniref:Outer membrane lipoprotein carrier protein, related to LolA n=2 Tax=Desulfobacula TaxID=28222 RepID=K0NC19_DESTT|nr:MULTISPECIES: outer membrane lipoprotein carrier protein LolA [Desulfobacula]CCK81994.1 outer membrane lipoprotein carrier protein, related to LolA [Desulfobacula toluolica Tol2]SDU43492.1 Outer membrane lipoprotein-sorting protein [Desulfobacula phenolica]
MKFNIIILLIIFLIPTSQLFAADAQIDNFLSEVEQNMSQVNTVHAMFVQKKEMAMFDIPIIIKGEFYIQNPDKFAWIVTDPIEYTLILSKYKVKKWDKSNGTQEMSLKDNPMFKAMIEQITFWFSGSYSSCKNDYDIKVIQKNPGILDFAPKKHNPASEMLTNITLTFQNDKRYISNIKLLEKNDDITELFFNDVILNSKIDKSVWETN